MDWIIYPLVSPLRFHSVFNLPTHDYPCENIKANLPLPHLLNSSVTLCFSIYRPHKSAKLPRSTYNTKLGKFERLWIKGMKFSIMWMVELYKQTTKEVAMFKSFLCSSNVLNKPMSLDIVVIVIPL